MGTISLIDKLNETSRKPDVEGDTMAKATKSAELPADTTTNEVTDNAVPVAEAVKIEVFTNIPIPEGRTSRESKYPWDTLDVGASFFVPGAKVDTFNTLCSSRNKKGEKKYIARKWTGKDGVLGVMVWRKS